MDVLVNQVLACTITVVVVDGNDWPVDRKLLKVGTAVSVQLSVQVGKDTALQ